MSMINVFVFLQPWLSVVEPALHACRVEHMSQLMGYHPDYLHCFQKAQNYILRGDGPLPYDYRHYIAIMVSLNALVVNIDS